MAAYVAGNDFQVADVASHDFSHTVRHVAVARAVETVAAHVELLVYLVWHGIEISVCRHGAMEGIVEHCHLRHVRHEVVNGADALQVSGVVHRCEVAKALYALLNLLVHEAALLEKVSALHYTVPHGINFVEAADSSQLGVEQGLEHEVDSFLMVGHIVHDLFFLTVGERKLQKRALNTNALHASLGQNALVVHVVEFILYRRTSTIKY